MDYCLFSLFFLFFCFFLIKLDSIAAPMRKLLINCVSQSHDRIDFSYVEIFLLKHRFPTVEAFEAFTHRVNYAHQ